MGERKMTAPKQKEAANRGGVACSIWVELNVWRRLTPIWQAIDLGLEIGSFLYQSGRNVRVGNFFSEFQKRRYLARNVLSTCRRISPLGYLPRLNTLQRGNRSSRNVQK